MSANIENGSGGPRAADIKRAKHGFAPTKTGGIYAAPTKTAGETPAPPRGGHGGPPHKESGGTVAAGTGVIETERELDPA